MAGYIGTVPVPQATETRDVYTATSNQTTFTTGGYTPNFVSVYLNGVHLARADYTATNGSDVVLAVGAAADDTVEIVSFNTFEVSAQTFTGDVTASGGTFLPTGDTAAGDDAAVGYAAADGLVLTGQGSTSDVTIKNDADATVMSIATGTTGATFAGDVIVPDGDLILGSTAVTSTAAELNQLDGVVAKTAGKETIWVPAVAMYPSENAGSPDPATIQITDDANRPVIKAIAFDKDSDEYAQFSIAFPKSWNEGTITFQPHFSANSTNTGTALFMLKGVSHADSGVISTDFGTAQGTAKAHSGTAYDLDIGNESSAITIAGSPAANEQVFFAIFRDVSGDNLSADALLLGIRIFFTTDATNDA